jgi:hypothetical protein
VSETLNGAPWSEDEDGLAVTQAALLIVNNVFSITRAARDVALALCRPEAGTSWRLRNKLWPRIEAEMERLRTSEARKAAPMPTVVPEAQPQLEPPPEPVPDHPDHPGNAKSELHLHLFHRPMRDGWTDERDLRLLDLAEAQWSPDELAAELGTTARDIKSRFDVLTCNRTFKRAAVLRVLQSVLASAQAAE